MSDQIVSLAILEPFPGKEEEFITHQQEFYALLARKAYSQDIFYRDVKGSGRYVHLRIWNSEQSRSDAQHDPDVHRYWQRLPELCKITTIYEDLERLYSSYEHHQEQGS